MGRVAEFLEWLRPARTGAPYEGKGDPGGGATFAGQSFPPIGEDSQALPGDYFVTVRGPSTGEEIIVGYHDPKLTPRAGPGERRIYSRDSGGNIVAEIHLKDDGVIVLNGVEIDPNGNLTAPGEVTAKAGGASVGLSTHLHNTAMGPSDKPTPGT